MRYSSSHWLNRRGALAGSLAVGVAAFLPAGCGGDSGTSTPTPTPTATPINPDLNGDISPVHDPSIIHAGDTYYVFGTTTPGGGGEIPVRRSKDLRSWTKFGNVFSDIPSWARSAIPGIQNIWAPDISFVNGKYLLYYACSTFGSNTSAIGLATNTTLDPSAPGYAWQDQGLVFQSGPGSDFNAIDPNHIVNSSGQHWLAFGSFWSGIKLIPLDPVTGKPAPGDNRIFPLASRPSPDAIEAPFVAQRGGFYYLFCSFDYCCQGANSTYYTVVGRAQNINGPYGDRNGNPMTGGYATVVLSNDTTSRWRGPGGASILQDGDQYHIVYHAYDALNQGTPTLRIAPLVWSTDGWPTAII